MDFLDSYYSAERHYFLRHDLLSPDLSAIIWDMLVFQKWHLFSSTSSIIEASCEELSCEVGNCDSENDWDEDVDSLGSLHHDDG